MPYSLSMRFDMICATNGIEHRLTKPNHPWTDGQVERLNRTLKEATVKRHHFDNHDQLRRDLCNVRNAHNYACRLKPRTGLTPDEYNCKTWASEPERAVVSSFYLMPGRGCTANLVHGIHEKGAGLQILEPAIDTAGPMGTMVLTVLGMVSELELSFIK